MLYTIKVALTQTTYEILTLLQSNANIGNMNKIFASFSSPKPMNILYTLLLSPEDSLRYYSKQIEY